MSVVHLELLVTLDSKENHVKVSKFQMSFRDNPLCHTSSKDFDKSNKTRHA